MKNYWKCCILFLQQISWVRRRDWHILSSGVFTYTNDERFQILHAEGSDDWTLQIKYVQKRDNGTYECQVSNFFNIIHPPPSCIFICHLYHRSVNLKQKLFHNLRVSDFLCTYIYFFCLVLKRENNDKVVFFKKIEENIIFVQKYKKQSLVNKKAFLSVNDKGILLTRFSLK